VNLLVCTACLFVSVTQYTPYISIMFISIDVSK